MLEEISDIWPVLVGVLTVYTAFLMGYIYFVVDRRTKHAVSLERKADKERFDEFRKELQLSFDETLEEIKEVVSSVVTKEHLEGLYLKKEDAHSKFHNKELANSTFLSKDDANRDFVKKSDF